MRYLKPRKSTIKINDKDYDLIFSLDRIDEIQDKTQLPMLEIVWMLMEEEKKKLATKVLLKFLTGQVDIKDDKLEYYSVVLLNTYIEQMKSKEIPGQNKVPVDEKNFEFTDVEYWMYIGTVELKRPEEEVWGMTLGRLRTLHNEHAKYNGWIREEKEQSLLTI